MIDPEQLMRGNYVWNEYSGEMIVSGILERDVRLRKTWDKPEGLYCVKDLEPIPLDEEWLIDFGFLEPEIIQTYKYYYPDENALWSIRLSNEEKRYYQFCIWVRVDELMKLDGPIQYVHQLQNLYINLTGKRLNKK